jgi:hypothetical protein
VFPFLNNSRKVENGKPGKPGKQKKHIRVSIEIIKSLDNQRFAKPSKLSVVKASGFLLVFSFYF